MRAASAGQPDTTLRVMTLSPHAYWPSYRRQERAWLQQRWPPGGAARSGASLKSAHRDETLVQARVVSKFRMKRHGQQRVLLRGHGMPVD